MSDVIIMLNLLMTILAIGVILIMRQEGYTINPITRYKKRILKNEEERIRRKKIIDDAIGYSWGMYVDYNGKSSEDRIKSELDKMKEKQEAIIKYLRLMHGRIE